MNIAKEQEFEELTPKMIRALRTMLGSSAILIDTTNIDYSVGRQKIDDNRHEMWTNDGYKISVTTDMFGFLMASQSKVPDPNKPPARFLSMTERVKARIEQDPEGALKAFEGMMKLLNYQLCINPYCTTNEGHRVDVDRTKKKSGACCRACTNYECTHPKCVKKATQMGWTKHTHRWGTKIAEAHKEYRRSNQ